MVLLRLVFNDLVEAKLKEFTAWWNEHTIRKQWHVRESPNGIPDKLFFDPASFSRADGPAQFFGQSVLDADLVACDEFLKEYDAKRRVPIPAEMPEQPSVQPRITRADLSLSVVPLLREILAEMATPTMLNAKSIYRVALYRLNMSRMPDM
jgi:hypothetical protein